ncbi:MAG: Membrane protein [Candidatus Peregrinibacteria bacterium GW2011_GWA2_38_36]|nr:MAG: Membrane protein [Candidatus Peregrinibacteria bacterium GW2011_GWA2_38_36]
MSDKAPEYLKDLGLSDQVFNESDMLAYGVFEASEMSDSDKTAARAHYVAAIALIYNAIEDFYAVHSAGEKLDAAHAVTKSINSPELKNRALQLITLVATIVSSGNVNNQLDSIGNFIKVESAHHSALLPSSSADALGIITKCETDVNFSGTDAAELNSAKVALLGLSKLVASKATTTSASGTDLADAWLKDPDASNFFPEDAIQNKLLAATGERSKTPVIERIGLIAQAEALLSTIETLEQANISKSLIDKAKSEILLRSVEELRKDVAKNVRDTDGISAKRHIAKAKLLLELMPEGPNKRSAIQKIASAEKTFGSTAADESHETKSISLPNDDGNFDEFDDNAFVGSRKPLLRYAALFGLLATFAAVVATHTDEIGDALSAIRARMSESSETEKAATHQAIGILDDALRAGAEKTGNDVSSLAPILSGKTAPVAAPVEPPAPSIVAPAVPAVPTEEPKPAVVIAPPAPAPVAAPVAVVVPEEQPVQPAAVTPEANENVPTFRQIDTALIHFGYNNEGKLVATGKMDFRRTNGTFELVDRDFQVDGVSYIKFKVTSKTTGKAVEIFVLSPAEIPKQEILERASGNDTFTVPVYTFSKSKS